MTVKEVAMKLGKDPCWVRAGIIEGWLPIGIATRGGQVVTSVNDIDSKKGRINYYIFPDYERRLEKCGLHMCG